MYIYKLKSHIWKTQWDRTGVVLECTRKIMLRMCHFWISSMTESFLKLSLWPSRRLSTTAPWQTLKLSIELSSVSLQDTHIGTVSLCFLPFIYFPFLCMLLHPSYPLPVCTLYCLSLLVISLELKVWIFPSFLLWLSCYSIHSIHILFYFILFLSVRHCLCECLSPFCFPCWYQFLNQLPFFLKSKIN